MLSVILGAIGAAIFWSVITTITFFVLASE